MKTQLSFTANAITVLSKHTFFKYIYVFYVKCMLVLIQCLHTALYMFPLSSPQYICVILMCQKVCYTESSDKFSLQKGKCVQTMELKLRIFLWPFQFWHFGAELHGAVFILKCHLLHCFHRNPTRLLKMLLIFAGCAWKLKCLFAS